MGFKKDFIWGGATASYQVEGAAYEDGKGLNIWDIFCKDGGHIYENQTGDAACDQYHRYKEDVAIMKELGLKCNFVFQEKFGAGEPSEAMIQTMYDAIPYDSYDRVIAVGGGGIPVIREGSKLSGTPAVIDKDFGSELLAELLDADVLVILTAVEQVAINFNKPDQKGLDDLTPAQAKVYMDENQFAKGSMLPKVQAAVKFAESKAGRTALITLLEKAKDGIAGKTGTAVSM